MSSGWHNEIWNLSHLDDLGIGSVSSGWLMVNVICHPNGIRSFPMSYGWHNVSWTLCYPDKIAPGCISSRLLMTSAERTEAYIRHLQMSYYLDRVKIITRHEIIIAWYEIIITRYSIINTLYAIFKRNDAIFFTRNAIINLKRMILTQDKSYFLQENVLVSPDTNLSWNFSRANAVFNKTRDSGIHIPWYCTWCVCIRGLSFILEMDVEEMTAFVSILRTNLKSLMPDKKVRVKLIVWVPDNIRLAVFAESDTIRLQITCRIEWCRWEIVIYCVFSTRWDNHPHSIEIIQANVRWCNFVFRWISAKQAVYFIRTYECNWKLKVFSFICWAEIHFT